MSSIDELAAMQVPGAPDPMTAAEQLASLLDLGSVGLAIRRARIVGRGSRASADLYLSDGSEITFESLRDVANPTRLALEIAACTGAMPKLKAPQAIRAVALLRALAEHEATLTMDQLSVEWGTAYLQSATTMAVDLNDQASRWEAFCALERMDPIAQARAATTTVAQASVVLRDAEGVRYVRCGWFRAHVRHDDPGASPQEIAHRMRRVGWQQRGGQGRIKATRPGHTGQLLWTFYTVPPSWEDER